MWIYNYFKHQPLQQFLTEYIMRLLHFFWPRPLQQFRYINEKLYTCSGEEAVEMFEQKPELFDVYHRGFSNQVRLPFFRSYSIFCSPRTFLPSPLVS